MSIYTRECGFSRLTAAGLPLRISDTFLLASSNSTKKHGAGCVVSHSANSATPILLWRNISNIRLFRICLRSIPIFSSINSLQCRSISAFPGRRRTYPIPKPQPCNTPRLPLWGLLQSRTNHLFSHCYHMDYISHCTPT